MRILPFLAALFCVCAFAGCGGSKNSSPAPTTPTSTANPVPVISVISPNTANQGGPAFTLTVTGSNFVSSSAIQWDGGSRSTSFVSETQLTAQISADDLSVAKPNVVTVSSPSPGGGTSNSVTFNIPCVIAALTPASQQTRARLGAYYFDGWAGPLTEYHFNGLVSGSYQDRQPLSGWRDDNACAVEQQIAWARNSGVNFFAFDWYFNPTVNEPGSNEDLDSAINIMHTLPDRHGMQFAILYVDGGPFLVGPSDWTTAVNQWTIFFKDSAYVLIDGKPLFIVIDMGSMRQAFGSSAGVVSAFNQLRASAQAAGFPGVYLVGGFGLPDGTLGEAAYFPDFSIAQQDGYDAVTTYNYPYAPPPVDEMLPFQTLSDTGKFVWQQAGSRSPVPFIPIAMAGWDPRPWGELEPLTSDSMWYTRSPQDFANFVNDTIVWAETNPQSRIEASPKPPMVMIEAWNEFGEGSHFVPSKGDGHAYGDELAATLVAPQAPVRTVLSLRDSGPSSNPRNGTGALLDAAGVPISGASIDFQAAPQDGEGAVAQYVLSETMPADASQVIVGFRVNSEDSGVGSSDVALYSASYKETSDGVERVSNADFSGGTQSWDLFGQAQLVPSDRGSGNMITAQVDPTKTAALNSAPFTVTPGANFVVSFSARVSPSSAGTGYFVILFLDTSGEFLRNRIVFAPGSVPLGSATTDASGQFQIDLTTLGTSQFRIEGTYAGDATHWPTNATVN